MRRYGREAGHTAADLPDLPRLRPAARDDELPVRAGPDDAHVPTCGGKARSSRTKCSKCSGTGHLRDAHRDAQRSGGRGRRAELQDHSGRGRTRPQRRTGGRPVHHLHGAAAQASSSATATTCIAMCRFPFTQAALGGEIDDADAGRHDEVQHSGGHAGGNVLSAFAARGIQQLRGTNRGDMFFTVTSRCPSIWARSRRTAAPV